MAGKCGRQLDGARNTLKNYARQLARGQINDAIFDELSVETKSEIAKLEEQIKTLQNFKAVGERAKADFGIFGFVKSIICDGAQCNEP
jgi:transposase-like protein